jgi:hypothetical protein
MLYRDVHASIEQRVQDLLSRMTLEEKVTQLRSMWLTKGSIEDTEGAFSEEKARGAIPNGIGQMARPSDRAGTTRAQRDPYRSVEETVAFVNAVQHFLTQRTRLGIPALFHDETAHGYLAGGATVFPHSARTCEYLGPEAGGAGIHRSSARGSRSRRYRCTQSGARPRCSLLGAVGIDHMILQDGGHHAAGSVR